MPKPNLAKSSFERPPLTEKIHLLQGFQYWLGDISHKVCLGCSDLTCRFRVAPFFLSFRETPTCRWERGYRAAVALELEPPDARWIKIIIKSIKGGSRLVRSCAEIPPSDGL